MAITLASATVRLFLPAAAAGLGVAQAAGEFGPAPVTAFALTPALRAAWSDHPVPDAGDPPDDGDEEELSLVATEAAAWQSLLGLAAEGEAPVSPRRLVLVADVPDDWARALPDSEPGAADGGVVVDRPVPWASVVSVLADGESLASVVRAALPAVAAGRTVGDLDDRAAVRSDRELAALDDVVSTPLLWFDPAELPHLFSLPDPTS